MPGRLFSLTRILRTWIDQFERSPFNDNGGVCRLLSTERALSHQVTRKHGKRRILEDIMKSKVSLNSGKGLAR